MALLENFLLLKQKIKTIKHLLTTPTCTSITNNCASKFNGNDDFAWLFKL